MSKLFKNPSIAISMILGIILAVSLLLILLFVPFFTEKIPLFSEIKSLFEVKNLFNSGSLFYFVFVYSLSVIAEISIIAVLFLLNRVRKGLVFSKITVFLVGFVSWGSLVMGAIFVLAGIFHPFALIFALCFFLLCLCLRVVKTAFEKAIEIKSENDLTV